MSGPGPLARTRALVADGRAGEAEALLAATIAETFELEVARVRINRDAYSLNSLNGTVTLADGGAYFFKFHQEEGEDDAVQEYYRAELLERAGFPVDRPAYVSRAVGRQILLYRHRRDRRFADVCRDLELAGDTAGMDRLVAAQQRLDDRLAERYRATLHADAGADSRGEPIHQLFHHRLVDPDAPDRPGGRARRFYDGATVRLPGGTLDWATFGRLRWRINGVLYRDTLDDLFAESRRRLAPAALADHGQVTAHGDAHNANVWFEESAEPPRLVLFDPAFAGAHVPALLAEAKTTFHNVFAHPFVLYDPAEAERRYTAGAEARGDVLEVTHDWDPGPLRRAFLRSKLERVWRPLLAELNARGLAPADAGRIVRCALFCCPTLVTNLVSGAPGSPHTPTSSLLAFAAAVTCGSEPEAAEDPWFGGLF